jgi:two-component sensor histidine kinase
MRFDATTAVFIHGAIDILLCLASVYSWKVSVRLPCNGYWAVGLFAFWIGHGSMFFYYMPGVVKGDLIWSLLPALGYVAQAVGITLLAKGSELLLGYSGRTWWFWPLLILGFLGGGLFSTVLPSENARIAVGVLVYAVFAIRGFVAFWRKPSADWNPGITGRLAGLQFLLIALLYGARAVSALFGLYGSESFTGGLFNSVHAIAIVALVLTLSQLVYKRFNDELKVKINENDLLVKELHHRTKNNLSLVASILTLEGGQQKEASAQAAFESVRRRVLALSALYERLQHGGSSAVIDLGDYLREITRGITASIGRSDVTIVVKDLVEGVVAPLGSAIPVGLIANELITNALKHVFPGGGGLISLGLHCVEGNITLRVEDNGIGKSEANDDTPGDGSQGIGSAIVAALVQQLDGSLHFSKSGQEGTVAEFHVPLRAFSGSTWGAS